MWRRFITMVMSGALVVTVMVVGAPASAGPIAFAELLTRHDVSSVYPGLADADRVGDRHGLLAPRTVTRDGRVRCDRYRTFRGDSSRHNWFFSTFTRRSVALDQAVIRMPGATRARAVLRHYRGFARACEGRHGTWDGEGGRARMTVRGWQTPRLGDGSVGLLVGFSQQGVTTWRRTLVVRVGDTITAQEVEPFSGTGSDERLIEVSRLAVAKLAA